MKSKIIQPTLLLPIRKPKFLLSDAAKNSQNPGTRYMIYIIQIKLRNAIKTMY
jgi:hypothetical protein